MFLIIAAKSWEDLSLKEDVRVRLAFFGIENIEQEINNRGLMYIFDPYAVWFLTQLAYKIKKQNNKHLIKQIDKFIPLIRDYHILKMNNKLDGKTGKIGNFRSYKELKQFIKSKTDISPDDKEKELLNDNKAKIIYKSGNTKIIHILSQEAAIYFGKKTSWCISREDKNNNLYYYEPYWNGNHNFYFIIYNNKPQYSLNFEEPEFTYTGNKDVDIYEIVEQFPIILKLFKKQLIIKNIKDTRNLLRLPQEYLDEWFKQNLYTFSSNRNISRNLINRIFYSDDDELIKSVAIRYNYFHDLEFQHNLFAKFGYESLFLSRRGFNNEEIPVWENVLDDDVFEKFWSKIKETIKDKKDIYFVDTGDFIVGVSPDGFFADHLKRATEATDLLNTIIKKNPKYINDIDSEYHQELIGYNPSVIKYINNPEPEIIAQALSIIERKIVNGFLSDAKKKEYKELKQWIIITHNIGKRITYDNTGKRITFE